VKQFQHKIADPLGLHGRPSKALVELAKQLNAQITVTLGTQTVSARSIFQLMSLGAVTGSVVTIHIMGGDEDLAFQRLQCFFKDNL